MKNSKYILHSVAALAVAALATACSSEEELTDKTSGTKETVTITAYQPNTRVGFDKNGDGYWQAGDKIGVWSNGDSKFSPFAIDESGVGKASATFGGTVTDGVGQYAVYPYNENHNLSGSSLTYYLPSSYTYTSVDQTFLPTKKNGNSFRMPMYGTITNNEVSFKHLGGVICIKIDKMPAESGTVKVIEANNQLCGRFTSSLSDDTPEIKTELSDTDNAVTFSFSGATEGKPGVFYLPVATGSYRLSVMVADGEKFSCTTDCFETVVRSKLHVLKVYTKYRNNVRTINDHKFVDLGLPSGLLWAETNIGAETAYDDGNYYAWGETAPKSTYSEETYTLGTYDEDEGTLTYAKYTSTDGQETLELADDAAYVNWGSGCRMPTYGDMAELCNIDNCTWTWVSCTNSAGETIDCYKVVSVKNGNIIYLPASGLRIGDGLWYHRSDGQYWSSSVYNVSYALFLSFNSGSYGMYGPSPSVYRYYGSPVRPVARP